MITVGVDLATEPAKTAMAVLRWSATGAAVQSLVLDVDDAAITNAATHADKLGIDCPLGWPDDFLVFLQEHHAGHVVAPQEVAGRDWRRKLAYRATDRAVRERTGLTPLSVAADRIGLTAMRAAGILSRLAAEGRPVDRAGNGIVVEVYPAASLRCWGLPFRAYKGGKRRAAREALIDALLKRTPWLDLGAYVDLCADFDDALDAVIAALTSRAAALSQTSTPDEAHLSSREFYRIGLSANTTGISVYVLGLHDKTYLARTYGASIGKASVTGYCIKFKRLSDINTDSLQAAIRDGMSLDQTGGGQA